MSTYLIYGKRLKAKKLSNGTTVGPDSTFRALTYNGIRVSRLADADDYATREDAQEKLDKVLENLRKRGLEDSVAFEIRKA